jgi:malonate transporter and related proteins
MMIALFALAPVFLTIAAGWVVRAIGIIPRDQWAGINTLAYWLFFPALLFTTIARADFGSVPTGPFIGATLAGFGFMAVLLVVMRPFLRGVSGPTYTSLFQAGLRWNGVVLLAAAPALFGDQGLSLAALLFAPLVPLINIACVTVLTLYGRDAIPSWGGFFRRLFTNPLILASISGILFQQSGLALNPVIGETLDMLARAALAGGLLGIGAGLDISALRAQPWLLTLAIGLKLIVMPFALLIAGKLIGLPPEVLVIIVAAGATPGAASSYVLARELGGDAELTAGHVTGTVILSVIALPFWIFVASL